MKLKTNEVLIGGGIIILLLLVFRKKPATITAEVETEAGDEMGGAGGVLPTKVTRESVITPVVVGVAPTLAPATAPVMNLATSSSPVAYTPTSPLASVSSGAVASKTSPIASTPNYAKPATSFISTATSPLVSKTTLNARFDGLDDYNFDGAVGF